MLEKKKGPGNHARTPGRRRGGRLRISGTLALLRLRGVYERLASLAHAGGKRSLRRLDRDDVGKDVFGLVTARLQEPTGELGDLRVVLLGEGADHAPLQLVHEQG